MEHTQLGAFTCGLFFMFQIAGTLAIYFKSRGHSLQRVVFWEMLYLLAISCFEFYVFFIHNFLGDQVYPITEMMQMTVVPMALFLLIRLTSLKGLHYPTVIINLSPYLLAFIAYILTLDPNIHLAILTFTCLHGLGIIVYGFFAVKRFNKELKSNFSNDERISLRWLKLVLVFFVFLLTTWTTATLIPTELTAAIYNVACIIIFGSLCYFVYRQEDMLEKLNQDIQTEEEVEPTEEEMKEFKKEISKSLMEETEKDEQEGSKDEEQPMVYYFEKAFKTLFQDNQIYLDPQLNITATAKELGTNRTYLSNYLNQKLNTTFYDYVNGWRIRHSEQLLQTTDLSLDGVAELSGFNSLSSFRRNFIKIHHCTPTEYRNNKQSSLG